LPEASNRKDPLETRGSNHQQTPGCIEGPARQSRPGPSGPASAKNMPKGIFFKRCGPFDFYSAGGGVYVAEEQMKFASAINFWP
jgi:hypothetical protein